MKKELPILDGVHEGDSVAVMNSWPAGKCAVLLADPPYGNRGASYGRARRRILGDENPMPGLQGIAAAYRLLKRDAVAFIFTSAQHLGFVQTFLRNYTDFRPVEVLCWSKGSPGFGYTFRRSFELIVVCEKGSPRYSNVPISTVLEFGRGETRLHPHSKPIPLLERLISIATSPGDIVLDPFCGSGSSGLAALNLGRRFIGIEIDPAYVHVARNRLSGRAVA